MFFLYVSLFLVLSFVSYFLFIPHPFLFQQQENYKTAQKLELILGVFYQTDCVYFAAGICYYNR